jgi:hypothetical protein
MYLYRTISTNIDNRLGMSSLRGATACGGRNRAAWEKGSMHPKQRAARNPRQEFSWSGNQDNARLAGGAALKTAPCPHLPGGRLSCAPAAKELPDGYVRM